MATMAEGASATCWPPGYAWPRILDLPPPPIRPRRRTGRNLARWSPGDGDGDGDGDGERLAVPSAAEHVRLAPLVTGDGEHLPALVTGQVSTLPAPVTGQAVAADGERGRLAVLWRSRAPPSTCAWPRWSPPSAGAVSWCYGNGVQRQQ